MHINVNILKSKICTDNTELLDKLINLYSFKVPGYNYIPAYRNKKWDGKKSFITRDGVFKTGLLDRILLDLKKIDCNYVVFKSPINNNDDIIKNIKGFEYYDFQSALIRLALINKRGIIKAPTGAGKTLIMAGILKSINPEKAVILFNKKQILTQTYEFFQNCGIENLGLCFGEGYIDGDIMLCTVQSIDKILDTHLNQSTALLVDEVHEFSKGKVTLAVINSFPNAYYRFGFTATVPTDPISLYNLEGSLGSIIEVIDTSSLIEDGLLTKPIIQLIDLPNEEFLGDYQTTYNEYVINNRFRNQQIKKVVEHIKNNNERARILILTKNLDHGRALEDLLGGGGTFIEGRNTIKERYDTIHSFRTAKQSSILIGTNILQTGVNIQEITHFVNARGLKSEIATLQALGRALRKHPTKNKVYIYDFLDKVEYLRQHSKQRKKHYKKEGHEIRIIKPLL